MGPLNTLIALGDGINQELFNHCHLYPGKEIIYFLT